MWKHLTRRYKLERQGRRGGMVQSGPAPLTKKGAKQRAATFNRLSGKQHRWRLTWTPAAVLTLGVPLGLLGVVLGIGLAVLVWVVL